jgi:hypothetical protein
MAAYNIKKARLLPEILLKFRHKLWLQRLPTAVLRNQRDDLILQWGLLPESIDLGYIFPIPKKGVFTPENSRPISLLEVHMKLLTRIINRRLVYALVDEGYFSEAQFGFHPGRSCTDAFHILLGAVEDAAERKREIHISVSWI